MQDTTELRGWIGRDLVDAGGQKIGTIEDIYEDTATGQPEWLAVHTGLFGRKTSFVPIAGSQRAGDALQVGFSKDQVKDAPHAEPDGQLSEGEEERLYAHYGMTASAPPATQPSTGTTDDAMTRSEEELEVGTVTRESGRVRLRKWVETEHVEARVPVQHEEVRVSREPITDANIDRAMEGAEITEAEHEVVLHEDEVVANTHVEPKERVRLETDQVLEEETVAADLRKEHIEVEGQPSTRS